MKMTSSIPEYACSPSRERGSAGVRAESTKGAIADPECGTKEHSHAVGWGCARAEPSKRYAVVHRVSDLLRAVEVPSRGGQILVSEQSLNLLQLAAGLAAEFGARAAQVMGTEM